MDDKELQGIVENVGFEQVLVDAHLTVDQVAMILHESGYIDLEIYLEGIYD